MPLVAKLSSSINGVVVTRFTVSVFCLAITLGCGRSQNAQVLQVVGQGKLPQRRNPSKQVVRDLVGNSAGARVSVVWLIDIDLADPQWAHWAELSKMTDLLGIHGAMTKNTDGFVVDLPTGEANLNKHCEEGHLVSG